MKKHMCMCVCAAALSLAAPAYSADAPAIGGVKYSDSFVLRGGTNLQQVVQLTGKKSINRTENVFVEGTDLGSFFEHNGKVYQLFGDTFAPRSDTAIGAAGQNWRGGVMAFTTDKDPRDGVTYDGWVLNSLGRAKELLPGAKKSGTETSKIPTYGFSANGVMYHHYMSVNTFNTAIDGEWLINHSGFAKSTDDGQTWTILENIKWPSLSNFGQVAVCKQDGEVYVWGIPSGRGGDVKLLKFKETDVEQFDKYLYFAGTENSQPKWSGNIADAVAVARGPYGEFAVMYNEYLQRWLITSHNRWTRATTITEGVTPWGPFGEQVGVLRGYDFGGGLYAPYTHPWFVEDGGRTLYFTISRWSDYNVHWFKVDLLKKEDVAAVADYDPRAAEAILFEDDFESGDISQWNGVTDGGEVRVGAAEDGNKFLQLKKLREKEISVSRGFTPASGKVTADFNVLINRHTGRKSVVFKDGAGSTVFELMFSGRGMEVSRSVDGNPTVTTGITAYTELYKWYNIKAVMDLNAGKYDLYMNGVKMAEQTYLSKAGASDISSVGLNMSATSEGSLCFADLMIY